MASDPTVFAPWTMSLPTWLTWLPNQLRALVSSLVPPTAAATVLWALELAIAPAPRATACARPTVSPPDEATPTTSPGDCASSGVVVVTAETDEPRVGATRPPRGGAGGGVVVVVVVAML